MAHKIAVIGGDGIGPEVTAEALKVVGAAGVATEERAPEVGIPSVHRGDRDVGPRQRLGDPGLALEATRIRAGA